MTYRAVAIAMATPSCVAVPRPSSSSTTNDLGVALLSMLDASSSSSWKVDLPCYRLSRAPMRVYIASKGVRTHPEAGTKLPICARSTTSAAPLTRTDLPPMLGPVTIQQRGRSCYLCTCALPTFPLASSSYSPHPRIG